MTSEEKSRIASLFGRMGGKSTSKKKQEASRRNGAKHKGKKKKQK